jgi:DNA-binding NarL/FixJ family response regulator
MTSSTVAPAHAVVAPIRVALVEDDFRMREALRMLLDGTPGFEVVGAFGSVEEALRRPVGNRPDVVLLDINLPGMSGSDGVGPLKERFRDPVVLMLTVLEDEDRIFRSLCNGASGYVLKKTPPARLLEQVGEAATGGAPMSPEIAAKVVRLFRTVAPQPRVGPALTPTERQLLALLAEGHSYQQAATRLEISVNTVRNHVRSIYDKLQVHSKSEAVSRALRSGLI